MDRFLCMQSYKYINFVIRNEQMEMDKCYALIRFSQK